MRGGKREGAGRKPSPETKKIPISFKVSQEVHRYLATVDNKTTTLEGAVMGTRAFKAWRRQ